MHEGGGFVGVDPEPGGRLRHLSPGVVVEQLHQLVQQDPAQCGRVLLLDRGQPVQQRVGSGRRGVTARTGIPPGGPQCAERARSHVAAASRSLDGEYPVEHPQPPAGRNQKLAEVA